VWGFADSPAKDPEGGTSGRSTAARWGLQHQDGTSPMLFSAVPTCADLRSRVMRMSWPPFQDGIRRMYQEREDRFYYICVITRNYAQPPDARTAPGVVDGILKGFISTRRLQMVQRSRSYSVTDPFLMRR